MNVSVEDVVAEGDKVVTRVTLRGTHQGETEEFGPPTGRQFEGYLITISRIEGGKIVEDWDAYDNLTTLQRWGLLPNSSRERAETHSFGELLPAGRGCY